MQKIVAATSLNFRNNPEIADNIIGVLHLGQSVDVIDQSVNGYVKVKAHINGRLRSGFSASIFLREPVGKFREALVSQAVAEWRRFNFGLGRETRDPYFEHVGEMWKAINLDLDGKDSDVPWSAAAISFMVRNAGKTEPGSKYGKFRFAAAHARYIHDSITKRFEKDENVPFWGFELHERKPELGDLVCKSRSGSNVDFDQAREQDAFKSHCDIIVRINTDSVTAIGGNVSDSVKTTEYGKTPDGVLDNANGVFALLSNQHS